MSYERDELELGQRVADALAAENTSDPAENARVVRERARTALQLALDRRDGQPVVHPEQHEQHRAA
jgi:hypothetical protein